MSLSISGKDDFAIKEKLYNDISNEGILIKLERLYEYKDIIFSDDSIVDYKKLLDKLLTYSYDRDDDSKEFTMQRELIELALDRSKNVTKIDRISAVVLYECYDILLNHFGTTVVLEKVLHALRARGALQDVEKKAELLELYWKIASENNVFNIHKIPFIHPDEVKALLKRGVIDDAGLLKLVLKAYVFIHDQGGIYEPSNYLNMRIELLEELFNRGVKIEDLPFDQLNIEDNHVSILRLLLEKGLDPIVLLFNSYPREDFIDVLKLAIEKNVEITPLCFVISLLGQEISTEAFELLIKQMDYSFEEDITLAILKNDFMKMGPKFKEYFEEVFGYKDFDVVISRLFRSEGSLLHIVVESDKKNLVEYVLENYPHDINVLNSLGQSPLFFARSAAVLELLIAHKANLSIKDYNGNYCLGDHSLEIIEYLTNNNHVPQSVAEVAAMSHFGKGNYEYAAKLYNKVGFELRVNPLEQMVGYILNSLEVSVEKNKYQAILHLINNAGINIPSQFAKLLTSVQDDHQASEFEFLNGLIHKLAQHYINLSKARLSSSLGAGEELNDFFASFDVSDIKVNHTNSYEFLKISDKFSAYYQVVGKALSILDNDFTLEVMTINGLRPDPVDKDIIVYRGMTVSLSVEDIESYFKFDHRAFSIGEYQKTLGFYVNQVWNDVYAHFEYGGTYVSIDAMVAARFSNDYYSKIQGILLEIKIPKGTPKICGSYKEESELILSTVSAENIVAIYTLNKIDYIYQIDKIYKNPYIDNAIIPSFSYQEEIEFDVLNEDVYNSLGCADLPRFSIHMGAQRSALYKNYTDFILRYPSQSFAKDQDKLIETYFSDRDLYVEEFTYHKSIECDIQIECCIY